ncbi:MAG: DsbA family oxidoreductase [Persicimonas sp.]
MISPVRHPFFRRNRNICQRDDQLAVAERVGVDPAGLERRLDNGSALAGLWEDEHARNEIGVRGSPTYVFENGRAVLYGDFPFSVLHSVVEELVNGLRLGGSEC